MPGSNELRERLPYLLMRTGEWAGMRLPRSVGLLAADLYPRLMSGRPRRAWEAASANLSRVLGHPPDSGLVQAATRESMALYGRYWYETFALRTMAWQELNDRFRIEGREHIDSALQAGRGIVLALPHMGNWDAAGHWLSVQGYRMTSVAEALDPPELTELFLRHRRALGMGIVSLTRGREVGEKLARVLRDNQVVALVADRSVSGRGVPVQMFGATRHLPAGPGLLSLATNAPLCPAAVFTTEDGWLCRIEPPISIERTGQTRQDVAAVARAIAASFERFISMAPTDWHVVLPAWEEP